VFLKIFGVCQLNIKLFWLIDCVPGKCTEKDN